MAGTAIRLPVQAWLADTDGSERLSMTFSSVPPAATINASGELDAKRYYHFEGHPHRDRGGSRSAESRQPSSEERASG
jgi:hypothetical protein